MPYPGRPTESFPDQLAGALLGLTLGDALGAPVEAQPPAEARRHAEKLRRPGALPTRGPGRYRFGQVTDDSQLARELLLGIDPLGEFDPEVFADRLLNLVASGRLIGGGPAASAAARQLALGVPWHEAGLPAPYAGNGAAMRAGPLGLLYGHDPQRLRRVVSDQARITHQDARCSAGALAIAGAAAIAARREPIEAAEFAAELCWLVEPVDRGFVTVLAGLPEWSQLPPEEAARWVQRLGLEPESRGGWHGISSFVTSSVCWSLYAALAAPDDYLQAVAVAIAVGGDTDTLAAMSGSIVGGRVGRGALPAAWCARLTDQGSWSAVELDALARRLAGCAARERVTQ